MYTCINCQGVIVGRDIKLLSERKALKRVFGLNCSNCGSAYTVTIEQIHGPTIEIESEEKRARREQQNKTSPHHLET